MKLKSEVDVAGECCFWAGDLIYNAIKLLTRFNAASESALWIKYVQLPETSSII